MYENSTYTQAEDPSRDEQTLASDQPPTTQAIVQDDLLAPQAEQLRSATAPKCERSRIEAEDGSRSDRGGAFGNTTDARTTKTPPAAPDTSETDAAFDPADSGKASAPASLADLASRSVDPDDLESFRRELKDLLHTSLEHGDENRMARECREFSELYPGLPLSELPDDVWESVRMGIPLAAAFALSERRRERLESCAREINQINRTRSMGAVHAANHDYFTPEEVRSMTPEEVRHHYRDIRNSMEKWH